MTVRLVVFDCDGVLVDSEPVARAVLAREAARIGWALDPHRCTGHQLSTIGAMHRAETGRPLPEPWVRELEAALLTALSTSVPLVAGAVAALESIEASGIAVRIASNSSHAEMARKFAGTRLARLAETGRVHSAGDVASGKPAPDLFLAAAAAEGVAPAETLVVEDSEPGVTAAIAAGMRCLAYAPDHDGRRLTALGAFVFADMATLPGLVAARRRAVAA